MQGKIFVQDYSVTLFITGKHWKQLNDLCLNKL